MLQIVKIIRVKLDLPLLRATDAAARRARIDRSALIRTAVRAHLKRFETQKLEALDRRGYLKHPDDPAEIAEWEAVWEAPGFA
jgi:metal-responsive CopG/Arc/MetJ family transcriptional regulator